MALEYSPPARGTWTIAHVPLLIPDSYVIFAGASCCMRGVVLSAAECGAQDRFSMILVSEDDIFNGKMESNLIDGTSEILDALPKLPPCAVIFSGCIHETAGIDMDYVSKTLEARYPAVDFIISKMNPTMRKSGITPEELMRMQLYAPLGKSRFSAILPDAKRQNNPAAINIIGNIAPRSENSEVLLMLKAAGYIIHDLCTCQTYEDYLDMADAAVNVYMVPVAEKGAIELSKRLEQKLFYFPVTFDMDTLERLLRSFVCEVDSVCKSAKNKEPGNNDHQAKTLCLPDIIALRRSAKDALTRASKAAQGMKIAIDFSAVSRIFELAQLLFESGFDVRRVYTDSVPPGDEASNEWCTKNIKGFEIISVTNVTSRFLHCQASGAQGSEWLAIGQKAAYYCNTAHFVNIIENGSLWGFHGIIEMASLIEKAAKEESDMRKIIQVKAWGCAEECKRLIGSGK